MSFFGILLVLLSAVAHSLKTFCIKRANNKPLFLLFASAVASVIFLPLGVYFLADGSFQLSHLWLVVLSALIHALYEVFLCRSLKEGEMSLVYPIMRSAPAPILVLSILFFSEDPTLLGVVGILTVSAGIYLIGTGDFSRQAILSPIKRLFETKATRLAFFCMLTVVTFSLVDKHVTTVVHPIAFSYLLTFLTTIFFAPYAFSCSEDGVLSEWKANKWAIILTAILSTGGYLLILVALTTDKLSYVVGFRQLSIVFGVLLGITVLKEESKKTRLVAAVIIFCGAFMIAMAK